MEQALRGDITNSVFAEGFAAWYGGERTPFALAFGEFLARWT